MKKYFLLFFMLFLTIGCQTKQKEYIGEYLNYNGKTGLGSRDCIIWQGADERDVYGWIKFTEKEKVEYFNGYYKFRIVNESVGGKKQYIWIPKYRVIFYEDSYDKYENKRKEIIDKIWKN